MDGEKWIQYGPSPRILCRDFGETPMSRILWDYARGVLEYKTSSHFQSRALSWGSIHSRENLMDP